MRKLVSRVFIVTLLFSTTAIASDIAIFTAANWWSQAAADVEMQEIADNVVDANVQVFTANDEPALADWALAHTGNRKADLLILCGKCPNALYPAANAQPDGSILEEFLDDGNCIINTGDWTFYVCDQGNNGDQGMVNIMDLSTMTERWDDNTPVTVTDDGKLYTPSLKGFTTARTIHIDLLENDWEAELVLAVADDGNRGDPIIVRNSVTGGRVGVFFETPNNDSLPRGEVISEWINNWFLDPEMPGALTPGDGETDVLRTTALSWTPGKSAVAHDVYLGTSFDDVTDAGRTNPMDVLVSQGQDDTTYAIEGVLPFGQTYYWRIDEVWSDGMIYKGDVWTFTVESEVYPIQNVTATSNTVPSATVQGPEKLVDGSGLDAQDQHSANTDDMWAGTPNATEPSYLQFEFDGVYKLAEMLVWNYNMQFEPFLGYGIKDATVEYSQDGAEWTVLGDFEFAQGTGQATYTYNSVVPLEGVAAKYVRMTINSNFSNSDAVYGCSEIRFLSVPVQPTEPDPADGDTGVNLGETLSWRPGREATTHEVHMGTDPNALALAGTSTQASFTPAELELDATYYWQVVEVNDAEAISSWPGDVWTFAMSPYSVIDDFESYIDDPDAGDVIWEIWIDGWVAEGGDPANGGSIVGNASSPFAEQTIVHGGSQSMPISYDNTSASAISEVDLALSPAQDWTANGIESLSLWFYGMGDNTGTLYVKINDTQVLYDSTASDIAIAQWQPWNIDLTTLGGNLSNVTSLSVGVQGTGAGTIYVDDIRLYGKTPQTVAPAQPATTDLVAYYPLNGNANDSSGNGYDGTETGGYLYVVGVDGQALDVDGAGGYVDLTNTTNWPDGAEPRSMAAWLLTRNAGAGARFAVAYGTGTGSDAMFLGMIDDTLYGGGYADDVTAAHLFVANEWYHTALTYDGTVARLYANGRQINSAEKAWNLTLSRGHIGQQVNDQSEFWEGAIDEVYIYGRVLSPEEIAGLAGKTGVVHTPF